VPILPSPLQVTDDAEAGWHEAVARAAAVIVLLAVAVMGLRARGAFSHRVSSLLTEAGSSVVIYVFVAAEGVGLVACVILLALVLRRPRRRKRDDDNDEQQPWRPLVPWWARALGVVLALALLAAPFVILVANRGRATFTPPVVAHPSGPLRGTGHQVASSPGSLVWPLVAGVIIAAVAVLVLAVLSRRGRHGNDAAGPGQVPAAARVAEGLEAGSGALEAGGESRAAIIACYAAMERGFAAAGSAPAAADTPAEVLTRASRAGIVRSGPAEVLTGLFRRARYSTEPMTSADSGTAASALTQMRADLGRSGP